MSFFKKLKRGLGFSDDDEEYDERLFSDTDTDSDAPAVTAPKAPSTVMPAPAADSKLEFDAANQDKIFEKVLEIFNKSLPPFLAESVDRDAQVKYLREALDAGVKEYLSTLTATAEAYCEARWKQTRDSMSAEMEAIRVKNEEVEKKAQEIQQKQLSSDRQKRALSDRVHDLEATLSRLEAEREQYELENRSLVNRLKVTGVQQDDLSTAQAEIERLKAELKQLKENPGENTELVDGLREQQSTTLLILEEMRKDLAGATKSVEEKDKQLAEMQASVDEANAHVDECNRVMEAKMEEVDKAIEHYKEKIKSQKATIAERDAEIEALKATIAENLRLQAEREQQLQAELDAHRNAPVAEAAPVISEEDISAIERTFETEGWFTKTPPAETPSMRQGVDDADFGYTEPPRKPSQVVNNDRQPSLFDF